MLSSRGSRKRTAKFLSTLKHRPSAFDRDYLRALQYAYYCHSISLVPDEHYDKMEREYRLVYGEEIPIGSDKQDDYTPPQRALALYFLLDLGYNCSHRRLL